MSLTDGNSDNRLRQIKSLLREMLLKWRSGELDEESVRREADFHWAEGEWPEYPENDSLSVVVEVLSQLSILDAQWIVVDDIAAIISFLDAAPGTEAAAWTQWRDYWQRLDYTERRKRIAGVSFYSQSGPGT